MEIGFKTDTGLRRDNNEDSYYFNRGSKVFVVADGVGGNRAGEIASKTAVNVIAAYLENYPPGGLCPVSEIEGYFRQCLKAANSRVLELSRLLKENRGMATTVVLAHISEGRAYIFNIGDSRAYLFHEGSLAQLTEDHTYVNSLVKAGLITAGEARYHEKRNMITRAVGADHTMEPDFSQTGLAAGDMLLLCTDGLHDEVTDAEIAAELEKAIPPCQICEDLVKRANDNSGGDNVTMILIKITEEDIK